MGRSQMQRKTLLLRAGGGGELGKLGRVQGRVWKGYNKGSAHPGNHEVSKNKNTVLTSTKERRSYQENLPPDWF